MDELERLCLYNHNNECKIERDYYQPCCTCNQKVILEEGQSVLVKTETVYTRKNGKIITN